MQINIDKTITCNVTCTKKLVGALKDYIYGERSEALNPPSLFYFTEEKGLI